MNEYQANKTGTKKEDKRGFEAAYVASKHNKQLLSPNDRKIKANQAFCLSEKIVSLYTIFGLSCCWSKHAVQ